MLRAFRGGFIAACLLAFATPVASAQTFTLGSAGDPMESLASTWWRSQHRVEVLGGFSLIGPQWRTMGGAEVTWSSPGVSARFRGLLRGGIYGAYQEDFDEWYDLARLVEFVRFRRPLEMPAYLRLGPVERLRLGGGHLVESYHSWTAWEQRTIGGELEWLGRYGSLAMFTSDLRLNNLVGAHADIFPFPWAKNDWLASFQLGAGYVTDISAQDGPVPGITGFSTRAKIDALRAGPVVLAPFISFANYLHYGRGLALGLNLESPNFADLLRLRVRSTLYYNSQGFIPGYVGAFYDVSNPGAFILDTEDLAGRAGVALAEARGGTDVLTEFYLLLFDRLELWYYFRRHYGSQALSVFHARLALTLPGGLQFAIGEDRGGLESFFSLFNDLNDQAVLVFRADYPASEHLRIHLRARYTYEQLGEDAQGRARYLVVRRFEPSIGFQLVF